MVTKAVIEQKLFGTKWVRVKTTHFRESCPFNNTWHFTGGYQRQIVAIFFLSVSLEAEVKDNYISQYVAHSSRKNLYDILTCLFRENNPMESMDKCTSAHMYVCQAQVTLELSTKHWTESRDDPLDLGRDVVVSKALV